MNKLERLEKSILYMCVILCGCLALNGCDYLNNNGSHLAGASYVNHTNSAFNDMTDMTPVSKSGIYFDTVITITLYGNDKEKYIDGCFEIADKYEALFSKSVDKSDVSRINSSNGEFVKVSADTIDILKLSKKYSDLSEGKFSLVCGALTSLWNIGGSDENTGFNSDNTDSDLSNVYDKKIPSDADIKAAMLLVGDDKIEINEATNEIRILYPGVMLDFGAAAKGYIADNMKEYLTGEGIESGIISLGGNILLIGNKPSYNEKSIQADKATVNQYNTSKDNITGQTEYGQYTIGITKPFTDNNEMIATLRLSDTSVVTSGNYQRYFEKDGRLYHHIIDLTTGYPAETGLNSVSIICPSSLEADIMSTTCYLLGKEKGTRLCESLDLKSVFVSSDNEIVYSSFHQ